MLNNICLHVAAFLDSNEAKDYDIAMQHMKGKLENKINALEKSLNGHQQLRSLLREFKNYHKQFISSLDNIHELIIKRNTIITQTLDVTGSQSHRFLKSQVLKVTGYQSHRSYKSQVLKVTGS